MRRRALLRAALALAAGAITGCRTTRGSPSFDATVGTDAPGAKRYASVADALRAAPADATRPWRIALGPGRWHEKLVVDRPEVHIIGAGRGRSVITHDTAAGQLRPDGTPWGTWGCATLTVTAPGFAARGLTIENAFDYIGNLSAPVLQPIGPNGPQAVALMLAQGSDRAAFADVEITSHQDTLFVDAGRSHFRNCRIAGSVDFVFGAGRALFDECELASRFRPGKERQGYIAAPSTRLQDPWGLVFRHCRLTREEAIPDGTVALGRAWRPTRDFPDGRYGDPEVLGAAAFLECWMDAHIGAVAWDPMAYTARDGSRVMLEPADARFAEFASSGPGAQVVPARPQLSAAAAAAATRDAVLGGWAGVDDASSAGALLP